ncbi:MAG TPA: hypothetical protein H9962_08750 [Candidatus Mailhella merdigallinarum]|uniref:Uncharacterized protein n=1 Tax=Candidatus Mailhella merdigallinarum TaxID=2838658 RepID=A0A9D2HG88_9BACT|nr:hypothetical protein [Candidatus Mailhella merdigallinarum]
MEEKGRRKGKYFDGCRMGNGNTGKERKLRYGMDEVCSSDKPSQHRKNSLFPVLGGGGLRRRYGPPLGPKLLYMLQLPPLPQLPHEELSPCAVRGICGSTTKPM